MRRGAPGSLGSRSGGVARDDERENMTSAARDFEKILFVMTNGIPMHRFSRIVT